MDLISLVKNKVCGKTSKRDNEMLPKNTGRPTSTIRKILLLAFVVGFWLFFYWYRGIEYSGKKPTIETTETTPPVKSESRTSKKQS